MSRIFFITVFVSFYLLGHCTRKEDSITRVEIYCLNIRANTPYNIDCSQYFQAFEKENILHFCLTKEADIQAISESIKLSSTFDKTDLDIRALVRIYYASSRIDSLCLPSESHKGLYLYNNVPMKFSDSTLLNFIDSLQRSK